MHYWHLHFNILFNMLYVKNVNKSPRNAFAHASTTITTGHMSLLSLNVKVT